MVKPTNVRDGDVTKIQTLEEEIRQMLDNPNPLTGIYSIYGDYPIEGDAHKTSLAKKLERMNAVR
ncbi:MAG: hypothetical protein GWN64_14435 [Candidatus Thorarchaeota archaeon]|nr:hypothetical protein [Candidatus Thorarchaeota archaeon]